jgi:hypothetical protein
VAASLITARALMALTKPLQERSHPGALAQERLFLDRRTLPLPCDKRTQAGALLEGPLAGSVLSDQNAMALKHLIGPKACTNYLVKHALYRFEIGR